LHENPHALRWLNLQHQFLEETVDGEWERWVWVNGTEEAAMQVERNDKVLGSYKWPDGTSGFHQHAHGLQELLKHFQKEAAPHNDLLFLDIDAFPHKKGWKRKLTSIMEKTNKVVSAIVRTENWNLFAHASVVFVRSQPKGIPPWVNFIGCPTQDLLGHWVEDPCVDWPTKKLLPIFRTNRVNLHPLFYGIYGHHFYHHGAGARTLRFTQKELKGKGQNFHDPLGGGFLRKDHMHLTERFFKNPKEFISALDWEPQ